MKKKRNRFINYSVMALIFVVFFVYLLFKYRDDKIRVISAFILFIVSIAIFLLFIIRTNILSLVISKDNKNKKKFMKEINKSKNSMFISFTDDVLEGAFEKELRKNDYIKENIMSYVVEIGYDNQSKPALFIRLFLLSKNILSLYCDERELAMALISNDMRIINENTILYEDSSSLYDLEEKILYNVNDLIRK